MKASLSWPLYLGILDSPAYWINRPMTRPLTGERIDLTSSGVIEHGAFSACVVLVDLISIFNAAVERRLSETPPLQKMSSGCFRCYELYYGFVKTSNHFCPGLYK